MISRPSMSWSVNTFTYCHIVIPVDGTKLPAHPSRMISRCVPVVTLVVIVRTTSSLQVTPPEHAGDYSESLILLPRTYQANMYEGFLSAEASPPATSTESERAVLR